MNNDPLYSRLAAMRRAVRTAGRFAPELVNSRHGFRPSRCLMVTLTYSPNHQWEPNHIKSYLNRVNVYFKKKCGRIMPYVWAMELHKSGIPHYHIIFWLPRGVFFPTPDRPLPKSKTGLPQWPFGMSNIRQGIKAGGAYLSKYVSKGIEQGQSFPRFARIYGMGGFPGKSSLVTWARAPRWLRVVVPAGAPLQRYPALRMLKNPDDYTRKDQFLSVRIWTRLPRPINGLINFSHFATYRKPYPHRRHFVADTYLRPAFYVSEGGEIFDTKTKRKYDESRQFLMPFLRFLFGRRVFRF